MRLILLVNLVLLGLVSTAAPAQASHAWLCEPLFDWTVTHGTPGDDTIIGVPWDWDCIAAKAGDDTVKGGTGEDAILGGPGADSLLGQAERDAINGQGGNDVVLGGPGSDRLFGGQGDDTVRGGDGDDNIFGGGFCAETAGAAMLIGTALGGIPVSTTHTITGSILGVGATQRLSAVRWGLAGRIVWAWILTIPLSGIIAALAWFLLPHG